MREKIINFVKYNNAFSIAFAIAFLSFGVSFAASPAVRDSIYSSKETIVSVDNSQIVSADLDNFNFNLKIDSINEDDIKYYIDYSYQTLTIKDGVWQKSGVGKTLTVRKDALEGKDLGIYAAKQLAENINYELSYLKKVQKSEKEKGESHKIVTVQYSGLIGKLLNPKEKIIEGYTPVIQESTNTEEVKVHIPKINPPKQKSQTEENSQNNTEQSPQESSSTSSTSGSSTETSTSTNSTSTEESTSTESTATTTSASTDSSATSTDSSASSTDTTATSTDSTSTSTDITSTSTDSSATSTDTSSSTDNTATSTGA